MNIIKIDKHSVDNIENIEDNFQALSLYDNYLNMNVKEWINMTVKHNHEAYGLFEESKLIGLVSVDEASDYRMVYWKEIRSLYVHPQYTDLQYGSKLIGKILNRVDDRGFENTYVWVMEDNQDARDFFELQNIIPNGNRQQRQIEGTSAEFLRYVYVNL